MSLSEFVIIRRDSANCNVFPAIGIGVFGNTNGVQGNTLYNKRKGLVDLHFKSVVGRTAAMVSLSGMLLLGPLSICPVTAEPAGQAPIQVHGQHKHGDKHGCGFLTRVSKVTGLTPEQIMEQRKSGKSLVQIAQSKGVSEDKLIAAIMEPVKAKIAKRVSEGKISQEEANKILAKIEAKVKTKVNNTAVPSEQCRPKG